MNVYSPYGTPDFQMYQRNYNIRGNYYQPSPQTIPLAPIQNNMLSPYYPHNTYPHNGAGMYYPMQTPQESSYITQNSSCQVPSLETVLRTQVQDYIKLGLEKQISEVSASKGNTKILKDWLKQHRNNPYPTKTDKVMLAYSTNMTMTQISNWFANSRRRIKLEKSEKELNDSLLGSSCDDKKRLTCREDVRQSETLSSAKFKTGNKECALDSSRGENVNETFQSSFNETNITPDSGLESFIETEDSFEKRENAKDHKDIKCKTNLFGTDPLTDVTVEPLETKPDTINVTVEPLEIKPRTLDVSFANKDTTVCLVESPETKPNTFDESFENKSTTAVYRTSKIWSITDILNSK
ncbi:iroquois-class homeodomain protein IRX-3-like [Mytilus edulis]|uniref:iroquois-class homeodomain protein IRX-3-like n=1 Tax=Mytilus edulis TaxID=6550 RepID=UPI0039EE905C